MINPMTAVPELKKISSNYDMSNQKSVNCTQININLCVNKIIDKGSCILGENNSYQYSAHTFSDFSYHYIQISEE